MKKLLSVAMALWLAFPVSWAYCAAGSCTADVSNTIMATGGTTVYGEPAAEFKVLTYTCTFGTGGDASTALSGALTTAQATELIGWFLLMGTTLNGATAPTALYDLYLKETVGSTADAIDILGTAGTNRPGTAGTSSQFTPITDTTYASGGPRPVLNTLKLTASGNAVESGAFTAQFIFVK